MTIHEYIDLAEKVGDSLNIDLERIDDKEVISTDCIFRASEGWACGKLKSEIGTYLSHLSIVEEKLTPGQKFDNIMAGWKQSSHNVDIIADIIEWRNKLKDILD